MYLTEYRLTNFRNYARLEAHFDRGLIVLYGQNAQGKTNFLESIAFLSTARSVHARRDAQLVHFDAAEDGLPFASLEAVVQRRDGAHRARMIVNLSDVEQQRTQKTIFWDEQRLTILDYIGEITTVLFLPQDMSLIASSPAVRRRYLNLTICQIDRDYCRDLAKYAEVLQQRNATLRMLQERGGDPDVVALWDDQLVRHGAYVIVRRQQIIAQLDEIAARMHADLTGGRERLHMQYMPRLELGPRNAHQLSLGFTPEMWGVQGSLLSLDDVETRFREELTAVRVHELERGMTLIGPHRDDVRFLVNGVDMTDFGSRGQQRTAALALKLAEVALLRDKKGEAPILLLDDVMSELDHERRRLLSHLLLDDTQVFMTTTDPNQLAPDVRANARLIRVEQGRFIEE
nr:DNA replication/repair protein RecF [Ardenticatena sp.]